LAASFFGVFCSFLLSFFDDAFAGDGAAATVAFFTGVDGGLAVGVGVVVLDDDDDDGASVLATRAFFSVCSSKNTHYWRKDGQRTPLKASLLE
jgi:hypothetical protein